MAESIVYGLAQEVLKNIGASALNEIASVWGFKAQLDKLNDTITTVKNVLLNAEDKQVDDHAVRGWLERLSFVVYAADDLFDEFNTIASRKKLMGGNSISMKVRAFLSNSNYICFAFKVSRKIREIREQIEAIVKDGEQFQFLQSTHEGGKSMKKIGRDQTYSFVDAQQVIGRDADKDAILNLLLASSSNIEPQNEVLPIPVHVPVISIVGIGGQGKTTLAQLVYNDPKVEKSFDLRLWVCISEVLDLKGIVEKILRSATKAETPKLEIEQLQVKLREEISGKKYLLVMDDVWDENREKWLKLRDLLKMGGEGSKILVTTRSKEVARIMESLATHELQGLTNEKSLELFVKMAFEPGQAQQKPSLVELGKEIVKKCANVPLAIRTLGSLLYGEEERKWSSLINTSLSKLSNANHEVNDIISILKLSYNDLWSPLKNCFAYCALFSKAYEFDKEMLQQLWMAEGFIVADDEGNRSLEDIAEDYFHFLLQRCFFQDIKTDEGGAIIGCKMHDLMHDLAQSVAGAKCKVASQEETSFDGKIIHLSYACRLTSSWKIQDSMRNMQLMRTFLIPEQKMLGGPIFSKRVCKELISSFSCLRVLDLHNVWLKTVPDSIGSLTHLRYLNLSKTSIKELPNSITKHLNLQTLNLYGCWNLEVLPKGIRKLENLRSLDVGDCDSLLEMPRGIGKLTLLQKLPLFISNCEKSHQAKLSELKQLKNLRGKLLINIRGNMQNSTIEATEANLIGKQGLDLLRIELERLDERDHEPVLEGLKPHSNLKKWEIVYYNGKKFPSWAIMDNLSISLPNLVNIELFMGKPSEVPVLSQLRFLKYLYIWDYQYVEYMENGNMSNQFSSSSSLPTYTQTIFFPSLQELNLSMMNSLKGWRKEYEVMFRNDDAKEASYLQKGNGLSMLSFSKLSKLTLFDCPKLITFPLCPNLEELDVRLINESVLLKIAATSNSSSQTTSRLKKLKLSNAEGLISLPMHCLHQLSSLTIDSDRQLKSTDTLVEVFARLSSFLRYLEFHNCSNLRSISKGLGHLTALETLKLAGCKLDFSPNQQEANEDEDDMPWKAFKSNLRSLKLSHLQKLVVFPSGFQHLANLRSLDLECNYELRELPEWISCLSLLINMKLFRCPKLTCLPDGFRNLTNLKQLMIANCSSILTERCKGPNGSDWLKIQHIPFLNIW